LVESYTLLSNQTEPLQMKS